MQVNVKSIDTTLASLLGGSTISTFDMGGREYDVNIKAADKYLHNLNALDKFQVKNAADQLVPLSNLIHIRPIVTQTFLPHYDRLRAAMIGAQLSHGYKLGQVVNYLQTNLPKLLPNNTKYAFKGNAKKLLQSNHDMAILFILSIIFIYLVLSAQFESFTDPFIILLVVPLCIVGALFSLKMINGSINIYTSIGLVTLIGLVAKHGILITQFTNQLINDGMEMSHALIKAASLRLRPILMTTAAMIFGTLPLVFATGASAISRRQIGIVIIGGLFFGTFFSLIVVPVTYSIFKSNKKRIAQETPQG